MEKLRLKRLWFNRIVIVFIILNFGKAFPQNLVINSSFEDTIKCYFFSPLDGNIKGWKTQITSHWGNCYFSLKCPTNSTGDRGFPYTSGYGYQLPRTGQVLTWDRLTDFQQPMFRDWVTYMQSQLNDTLKQGQKYIVGCYTSRCQEITYAVRNLGIYLSTDSLALYKDSDMIRLPPQVESKVLLTDTVNWMLVMDTVTAIGNEKYITIGRFTDLMPFDTLMIPCNYQPSVNPRPGGVYLIDDVFIVPLDTLSIPTYGLKDGLQYDAVYCSMDYATVSVKESFPLVKYTWYNSNLQVIDSINPSIHPRLTQSETFYLKRQNPAGQIRWDTAYVSIVTSGCLNTLKDVIQNKAVFYPNPTARELNLLLTNEQLQQIMAIEVYNPTGQNVKTLSKKETQDISDLPAGVYMVLIKTNKGEVFNTKLVKL